MNKLPEIQYYNNNFPGKLNDNLLFYFSFDSGNSIIMPISGVTGQNGSFLFSGEILPALNNFWLNSGYGYINNNYVKVHNTNNLINFEDFSFICVYENISTTGATLLSTVSKNSIQYYNEFGVPYNSIVNAGFEFGFTANNRLFFEFFDSDGPKVFISNFDLANKSSIFLNITNGNVSFGYYNFPEETLVSNSFNFNSQFIFNPTGLFIGKNPLSINNYNYNKQFGGYLEQVIMCSPKIYQYEIENINKSFISSYIPRSEFFNQIFLTGITGFTTGSLGEEIALTGYLYEVTGYTTGIIEINTGVITGFELEPTGIYQDEFGNFETGYAELALFGDIPVTGFIPLTGISSIIESGIIDENISENFNLILKYGKNNINILSDITNQDSVEIQSITGNYDVKRYKNLESFYDNINKNYIFNDIKSTEVNAPFIIFANGLLTTSGTGIQIGTVYSSNVLITGGDYIETEKGEFLFFGFDDTHSIFGDLITGNILVENNFSENNSGILNGLNINNYNIFLNGQKRLSTIFDNTTENYIQTSVISGKLILVYKNYDESITGFASIYNINNFFTNYSQVYKNGIRQRLNFDYIENGNFTLNNGRAILDIKNNSVYNNDRLF
jgi:hypothetical protein